MTTRSRQFISLWSLAVLPAAGSLPGALAPPARADVTLSAQQTVAAGQTPPVSVPETLFLKGANARLEAAGEPTLVYDGKANVLYSIRPSRRTYSLTVPIPLDPTGEVSLSAEEVKIDTALDLRGTNQVRTMAGRAAHRYLVRGTVTYTRLRPGGIEAQNEEEEDRERAARRRRSEEYVAPQWSISGEVWLADTLTFPSKENTFLAAQLAAASAGPFEQPLAEALDRHKGVPLLARVTVTHTPARLTALPLVTVTTFTVRSLADTALPGTLFAVPPGYALVAAPLIPYAPGVSPLASP